jgi:hypothetical protein
MEGTLNGVFNEMPAFNGIPEVAGGGSPLT